MENPQTETVILSQVSILTAISDAEEISEEEYKTTAAITDLFPSKGETLKSPSNSFVLNYVVAELGTALKELKEVIKYDEGDEKSYVINTYILLCNGSNTHNNNYLKINYKLGFVLGNPTISKVEVVQFKIRSITVESLCDALSAI